MASILTSHCALFILIVMPKSHCATGMSKSEEPLCFNSCLKPQSTCLSCVRAVLPQFQSWVDVGRVIFYVVHAHPPSFGLAKSLIGIECATTWAALQNKHPQLNTQQIHNKIHNKYTTKQQIHNSKQQSDKTQLHSLDMV